MSVITNSLSVLRAQFFTCSYSRFLLMCVSVIKMVLITMVCSTAFYGLKVTE